MRTRDAITHVGVLPANSHAKYHRSERTKGLGTSAVYQQDTAILLKDKDGKLEALRQGAGIPPYKKKTSAVRTM